MDQEAFKRAVQAVGQSGSNHPSIGTYSEQSLHAVLKHYINPAPGVPEQPWGPFVVDVLEEDRIFEIQTAHFDKLRSKLEWFLQSQAVTLVYPVAARTRLHWLDRRAKFVERSRQSPKRGTIHQIFPELYRIKWFLRHPRLSLRILVVDVHEYRIPEPGRRARRPYRLQDCIPVGLVEDVFIEGAADYRRFLPPDLPETFLSRDYHRAAGISLPLARMALNILYHMGTVERTGRQGNAYTYTVAPLADPVHA